MSRPPKGIALDCRTFPLADHLELSSALLGFKQVHCTHLSATLQDILRVFTEWGTSVVGIAAFPHLWET